jgi:predicted nucleic acid-binding protein
LTDNQRNIELKLHQYKVKYIKKKLLEGGVLFLATFMLIYLTLTGLEAIGRFDSLIRAILLLTFIISSGGIFFVRVVRPLIQLFRSDTSISDEDAASKIGSYFPNLGDKLLNYIQLSSNSFTENGLAKASVLQRANDMEHYAFDEAISYKDEKRNLLRYVLPLVLVIVILVALFPAGFLSSGERIVNFNKAYIPQAPFKFKLPEKLLAFRNENYLLEVTLSGEALPQEAYFVSGGKKTRLINAGLGSFELIFPNITTNKSFTIEAASFNSKKYLLEVVDRPSLSSFSVNLQYPKYLQRPDESFQNIGSFEVPEGTTINWQINSKFTDLLTVQFATDSVKVSPSDDQLFTFNRQVFQDQPYSLKLTNDNGHQQGTITYEVKVIKDQLPKIEVKMLADTILYMYVVFAGNLSDDHGLRNLQLHYTKNNSDKRIINLPVDKGATNQSLFYQWILDSIKLAAGDKLEFFLQAIDNDAINRYKSTRSQLFYLHMPNDDEALEKLENSKNSTKEKISDAADEAKELKENIDKLVDQLKGKKELSWQEEQMLENLVEQKSKLEEQVENLKEENNMLLEQQKKFESPSSETLEKQEQLQELLNELMDDETRELYEKLQKLLESYENTETVQDLLQKIQNKELNLEQELERALEFFKQIQYEQKLQEASEELDDIITEQEELTKKTEEKSQSNDSLAQDQGKLSKKFNDFQEELEKAKELNQELKRPNNMEDTSSEEKEINEEQNKAKESLENNNRNKSKQSQKNATDKMKEVAKKIENMQSSMQMQQMQEDLGDLQQILNNLLELSFDQEKLMKDFKEVNQSDPLSIILSQEQLTLKKDSKIINDSLLALSARVMAISSFITRELNELNQNMDASIEAIRERKKAEAAINQQLTMTSTNNLALMLDNVMRQMQENMASAMGKGEKSEGDPQMPGMSEMQKQLNEQIRELSQSGKSGRELSEELAKLAAEQERIRQAMEEAAEKYGGDQGELDKMMQQMEDTEVDLVNKKLSRQLQQRQQQILSRMLVAEKAMRERELDSKREAKSATQYDKLLPKAFEDYVKQREKEIELLKTVPPRLVPFFKLEVGQYFERLKQQTDSINN